MLFVELRFFLFFAVVLLVYWSLPGNDGRKWFLLLASYYFYGSWDWRFAIMLLALSCGDYLLGRLIAATEDKRRRWVYVALSLTMNLSVLGYFKYFNFFAASAVTLASAAGIHLGWQTLHIILPVGVSFFTFQSLSYTIDVYRREIAPAPNMRDYLVFAAFFPQLVAGPIVRPKYFLPQLAEKRVFDFSQVRHLLFLFLVGFIKKACVADNISPFVDRVFAAPHEYSRLASQIATWLYAVQIYCDFSGYSDMAIAVAGFMGYKLVLNFDAPYLAASIQDFWRRWHISLSSWIRDYIYISLGGRSAKLYLTYRNLMITMLAGGLWHGANWTFVVWGGLHGSALVVNQEWSRRFKASVNKPSVPRTLLMWFITLNFVCLAWIFFRAPSFEIARAMITRYLFLESGGSASQPLWLIWVLPGLLAIQYAERRYRWKDFFCAKTSQPTFAFSYGACWALALSLLPLAHRPFIYFQF